MEEDTKNIKKFSGSAIGLLLIQDTIGCFEGRMQILRLGPTAHAVHG